MLDEIHLIQCNGCQVLPSVMSTTTLLDGTLRDKTRNWIGSLIQRGIDFRAEFDSYDTEAQGSIPRSAFRSAVKSLNHLFTDKELV